jgi:hypothetical protein
LKNSAAWIGMHAAVFGLDYKGHAFCMVKRLWSVLENLGRIRQMLVCRGTR